jgi:O-antigen ligase
MVALMGILTLLVFLVADEARGPSVSFESRLGKIPYNVELMADAPWSYVVGLGIARGYTSDESLLSLEGLDFTRADNFFLMIFVEGGLIGLGLFVNLLISIVKKLKTSHDIVGSPVQRASCSLAIGMLLYLIGWGFTSVSFRLFPAAYLTWMFIGVALSMIRHGQKVMLLAPHLSHANRRCI